MSVRRFTLALVASFALVALGAAPAMAKELRVDNNRVQCPDADYMRIQDAVNAAEPGDKIKVCEGTYVEQVRIDKGEWSRNAGDRSGGRDRRESSAPGDSRSGGPRDDVAGEADPRGSETGGNSRAVPVE